MNVLLKDKTVVVTGAGAGIGLGIVRQCIMAGANVIGIERDENRLVRIEAEGARGVHGDVGDAEAFPSLLQRLWENRGPIHGLVNNAGITIEKPLEEMSLEEMELLWRVNQRSVLLSVQALAPLMSGNGGGSVVNIASNHARASGTGYEAYAGTKGAIVAMSRAMAWSYGRQGIRVNALCPGLTMTEAVADAARDPALAARFRAWHANQRVNTVDEIGQAAAFLLSDAASAFTGADLIADQGMSSRLGDI
ncbi:SDR family NAD(P)-dependent oxidoreductase [Nitratireductor basaltis]|uniref:Short-chain dehydrogenase/reductase SDR n=1 Tax=Nitratireductor basaltis TaxID=472175 RepID=A0A084UER5_9HYPH|nr:SDR family oxidoreductase [Nitratireductor basaltis]KFB11451.1 Short-chain dehydrogenase/reductase SDR [Nitratireductor basaltis]